MARNAPLKIVEYENGPPLPVEAGVVWFTEYKGDPRGWMHFCCPCGCGRHGALTFAGPNPWVIVKGEWPNVTVAPSIGFDNGHWHGFIEDGVFVER